MRAAVNLSSFILAYARRRPERTALFYKPERISYAALARRNEVAGGWSAARGIGSGHAVAVVKKNSAAFLEIALAVSRVGGVFVPNNFQLAAGEVGYIAEISGARLLRVDEQRAASAPSVRSGVVVDERAQCDRTILCAVL